jgi:predicted TIM-barrel fold metal-dependent hydrolase
MMSTMIIDFCVAPPHPDVLSGFADIPPHLAGYERLYSGDTKELEFLKNLSLDDFFGLMDMAGVTRAVIHGEDMESTYGRKIPNEIVLELVGKHPDRFIGFIGADPHKKRRAVREIYRMARAGLKGVMIAPWEHGLFSDDKKYHPIYEACIDLDIPVWIHTSLNFSHVIPMEFGRPLILDRVAVRFPELKIVAGHAGWPWVTEMVAVLWRHANVYADISAIRPKYMGMVETGWAPLVHYGNTLLSDKILFSTAWPLVMFHDAVNDVKNLSLKPEVQEKWLWKNAAKLLKIDTEGIG